MAATLLVVTACKEKPQSNIIIAKKQTEKPAPSALQKMSDYEWSNTVAWLDKQYTVSIQRKADESLPKAKDESGNVYFDNVITLKVMRPDGSVFFDRTFKKSDFSAFADNDYGKNGALLGIVFDKAEGDYLNFAASIGSPDTMSDEYIPLVLRLSRMGDVRIEKDTQLDTASSAPRDEVEAAEEEGM